MITIITLNMILSIGLFIASLVAPLLVVFFAGKKFNYEKIPTLLLAYSLFFNVGCLFFSGFLGQLLYSYEIVSSLGWYWSPFQYQLGFSELSLAVLGFISPLYKREFWVATIIATVIWLFGAAGVHLYHLWGSEHMAASRFVIGWNIFLGIWLLGLYGYYRAAQAIDITDSPA